jgi:hypothetical protein
LAVLVLPQLLQEHLFRLAAVAGLFVLTYLEQAEQAVWVAAEMVAGAFKERQEQLIQAAVRVVVGQTQALRAVLAL